MNNKFIVITTINDPNKAIDLYRKWEGWQLIVVGDRKTNMDWSAPGVVYLNIDDQKKISPILADCIPENTYIRKIFGYLYAINNHAEYIFETDDDNFPYSYASDLLDKIIINPRTNFDVFSGCDGWVNTYPIFGVNNSWPRGFPLEYIKNGNGNVMNEQSDWQILQFLVNKDPDVDAIYRLTSGKNIKFKERKPVLIEKNIFSPFNSQATLWKKSAFPLMFFPIGVPDRVTDILRGYISQSCLWKTNNRLAFMSPIVFQERNKHNLLKDFKDEYSLYINSVNWGKLLLTTKGDNYKELFENALKIFCKEGYLDPINIKAYSAYSNTI